MLSQTVEYALRAVVFLAERPGKPHTIQQVAAGTLVPAGYLAKVLMSLAKHGILASQRGLGGGFTLAHTPESLTMYSVVQAVDPICRIIECPLGNPEHSLALCPLHKSIDEAAALIEDKFRGITIAKLAEGQPFAHETEPGRGD